MKHHQWTTEDLQNLKSSVHHSGFLYAIKKVPQCVTSNVKHGRRGVMFWGCFVGSRVND